MNERILRYGKKRKKKSHSKKGKRPRRSQRPKKLLPFFPLFLLIFFFVSMYMNNLMLIWHEKRKRAIDRLHAWILHANVKKEQLRIRTRSRNIKHKKITMKTGRISFIRILGFKNANRKFWTKNSIPLNFFLFCPWPFPCIFQLSWHRTRKKSHRIKLDYYGRCI